MKMLVSRLLPCVPRPTAKTPPVQLNDSQVLRAELFAKGPGKEPGVDLLTDGLSDSTGGETFDRSTPGTFRFVYAPDVASPSAST